MTQLCKSLEVIRKRKGRGPPVNLYFKLILFYVITKVVCIDRVPFENFVKNGQHRWRFFLKHFCTYHSYQTWSPNLLVNFYIYFRGMNGENETPATGTEFHALKMLEDNKHHRIQMVVYRNCIREQTTRSTGTLSLITLQSVAAFTHTAN